MLDPDLVRTNTKRYPPNPIPNPIPILVEIKPVSLSASPTYVPRLALLCLVVFWVHCLSLDRCCSLCLDDSVSCLRISVRFFCSAEGERQQLLEENRVRDAMLLRKTEIRLQRETEFTLVRLQHSDPNPNPNPNPNVMEKLRSSRGSRGEN